MTKWKGEWPYYDPRQTLWRSGTYQRELEAANKYWNEKHAAAPTDAIAFIRERDQMECDNYVLGLSLQATQAEHYRKSYHLVVMALALSTVLNVALILWRAL